MRAMKLHPQQKPSPMTLPLCLICSLKRCDAPLLLKGEGTAARQLLAPYRSAFLTPTCVLLGPDIMVWEDESAVTRCRTGLATTTARGGVVGECSSVCVDVVTIETCKSASFFLNCRFLNPGLLSFRFFCLQYALRASIASTDFT